MKTSAVRSTSLRFHVLSGVALAVLTHARAVSAQSPGAIVFAARDAALPAAEPDHQAPAAAPGPDRFFPGADHVSVAVASGVPFAGIGEVSLGATDWLTVGVMGGVADTMSEAGVGGRIQAALFRTPTIEMVITVPVLYYPPSKRRGGESWILTNPAMLLQGRLPWRGAHLYGGLGGLVASCTDDILPRYSAQAARTESSKPGAPMPDGVWDTVHFGGSVPVTTSMGLFVDGSVMLSGFRVSDAYAREVGVPAVAELGWSVRF